LVKFHVSRLITTTGVWGPELDSGGVMIATEQQIKELAYFIWQEEGCPECKDVEHYFRAKEMLERREKPEPKVAAPKNPTVPPAESKQRRHTRR
jgi:hypothetical protein